MLGVTLALVALLIASLLFYNKRRMSYWQTRGIPSPPKLPILGNIHQILSNKQGRWIYDNEVYRKYSSNGLSGVYMLWSPVLMVSDPDLIKHIFVKDFDHFTDRRVFKSPNEVDRPMNDMLSNENGEKWKSLRSIMTPTFTSGKIKNMFHLVCDKADSLVAFCLSEAKKKPHVNMKHNFGRYTMDTIASCAFGVECNSLVDEDAVFPKKADPFFDFGLKRMLKFTLFGLTPFLFRVLNLRLFPDETLFFSNVVEETLAARRKGIKRGDFLDLLLDAQAVEADSNSDNTKKPIIDDVTIIAQSVLFLIAGYDTTATTLAFTAYMLSKHPELQQKLRHELKEITKENGQLTYQGIMEAKYLDACVNETLRMYPPAPTLERICSKDYQIPNTNVKVTKGQTLTVSAWSLHHDEKYWPEPESYQPERFLPENKDQITPYTYMPFGLGPRNCIAMRFALMEAKVGLAKMVLATQMTVAPGYEELTLSTGPGLLKPEEVNLIIEPLREE